MLPVDFEGFVRVDRRSKTVYDCFVLLRCCSLCDIGFFPLLFIEPLD